MITRPCICGIITVHYAQENIILSIIAKYNSISDLSNNAVAKEFTTIPIRIAKEANKTQRELVGLDVK